jgi:hypothetical protein
MAGLAFDAHGRATGHADPLSSPGLAALLAVDVPVRPATDSGGAVVTGETAHRFLVHGRDAIYAPAVDAIRSMGLRVLKTPVRTSQANARWEPASIQPEPTGHHLPTDGQVARLGC